MKKIIIHAGFPKCASSTIQKALSLNEEFLNESRVAILGNEFTFGENRRGFPLWHLERLRRNNTSITDSLRELLQGESALGFDCFILSSENLNEDTFPELFSGIDGFFDTSIVFYLRPQFEWLASAWKQFEISRGKRLDTFIDQALESGYPRFDKQIRKWKDVCPKANFWVKPLTEDYLVGGSPESDFFSFIGESSALKKKVESANTSCDFSILHALMKNYEIFGGPKRTDQVFNKLDRWLPDSYKKTNIQLVSNEQKKRIADHFASENRVIAKDHLSCGKDAEIMYQDVFSWRPSVSKSYMDLSDLEIEERARAILQDVSGHKSESNLSFLLQSLLD